MVFRAFERIEAGRISLRDADGLHEFGDPHAPASLHARVTVFDPSIYMELATRGDMGAGEGWVDGTWTCDDLAVLCRIMLRNEAAMQRLEGHLGLVGALLLRVYHRLRRNSIRGSRDNIGTHYDLGNDFYRLWLDDTMTYSCAVFGNTEVTDDDTLETAQSRKYAKIARALKLEPGDSVLEIGCGWGGFALHAAKHYGCHVTATTISQSQYRHVVERVRQEGLGDCIEVLREDYRILSGQYDKLVSIEMFEAVGHEFQDKFFEVCAARLKPGGHMLLQTITIAEDRYEQARRRVDFIQRYIFPGGALPSDSSLAACVKRNGSLALRASAEIGAHYAATLAIWRKRFLAVREGVLQLGFDERFLRMWEFYLCYCQTGFEERSIGTVQVLIERS
jgi:cyclopropane-fatty-acyl-phospholipid synthase